MSRISPRLKPVVTSHVFWEEKRAFQLETDVYDEWVLFAVTSGRFWYSIQEQSGEAVFGDLVICPPHTPFAREVLETLSFHFYRFAWEPAGELPLPRAGKLTLKDHSRLSSTYRYLELIMKQRSSSIDLSGPNHLLRDIWLQLCVEAETEAEQERTLVQDEEMARAARWIQERAYSKPMLKELAASIGMSPVQFSRRFQAAIGQTPMDYLTEQRLDRARMLLLESDQTLDQIAEACGYENGFYLSRMFRKKLKTTPTAYRRSHQV